MNPLAKFRLLLALLVIVSTISPGLRADAQTSVTWDGSVGNWSSSYDWSGYVYPDNGRPVLSSSYNAVISSGQVTQDIVTGASGGAGVTLSGLTMNGGALILNRQITVLSGTLSSGSIGGAASAYFTNLNWTGGTISGSGSGVVSVSGNLTMNGSGYRYIGTRGVLAIGGTATLSGGTLNNYSSSVSGQVNILAGGMFDMQGGASMGDSYGTGGILNNSGLFKKTGSLGSSASISGWTLNNSGTMQTQVGTLSVSSALNNTGLVDVQSTTTLTLSGGGVETGGTFNIASGGVLEFEGGTYNLAGATFSNLGSINFDNYTTHFSGSSASALSGQVNVNGGTLAIDASTVLNAPITLSSNGMISTAAGVVATFNNLSWTGGTILGSGTALIPVGQTLSMNGSGYRYLGTGGVLVIGGTATLSGGTLNNYSSYVSGQVNILAGGVFDMQGGTSTGDSSGTGGVLNNSGLFKKTGSLGSSAAIYGWTLNNSGTIQTQAGTLSVSSALNNTGLVDVQSTTTLTLSGGGVEAGGTFNIASGGVIEFEGGTYNLAGSTFNNSGSINFDNYTTHFSGSSASALSGQVNVNGGTLAIDASTVLNAPITLSSNGTISTASGVVATLNNLSWTGGTILGSGTALIPVGQTLSMNGSGYRYLGTSGVLAIGGTATFSGGTLNNNSSYVSGQVNVLAGGVFDMQGSSSMGDSSGTGGILNNSGLFKKTGSGTASIGTGWILNNAGMIDIQNGTLSLSGSLIQTTGTLKLSGGTLTSTTKLNLQGGLLQGTGTLGASIFNNGTISPGSANNSAGSLVVTGSLSLGIGSNLLFEIGGNVQGTQYDFLSETGTATLNLNGTLTVQLTNGFKPTQTNPVVITTGTTILGQFVNVANGGWLVTTDGSNAYQVNYGSQSKYSRNSVILSTGYSANSAPTVGQWSALAVGYQSAIVSGIVNPNGAETTIYFDFGTAVPYEHSTLSQSAGSDTDASLCNGALPNLSAATLYHYRIVATNALGTTYGGDQTFTTANPPPVSVTGTTGEMTYRTAVLNGVVNPNGLDASFYFRYGPTTDYGSTTLSQPVGSGTVPATVSAGVSGLSAVTLYHYQIVAVNSSGTTCGIDQTFTTPPPHSNAYLSALVITDGILSPVFAASGTSYTATVANSVTSVTATPTLSDTTATVQVTGGTGLLVGSNIVTVKVTAQDGTTTKTYTISVNRLPSSNADLSSLAISSGILNPAFSSSGTSYTATVANSVTSVTVTPTVSDSTATVQVTGGTGLVVGGNVVTAKVTAQDGTTTKTYTIVVNRSPSLNADLSALAISSGTLSPVFTSSGTNYTASVANSVTAMTATPTLSDPTATVQVTGGTGLVVGPNTVTAKVTAQDGTTTKTYTIVVSRLPSSNADLSGLAISSGTLSPVFTSSGTSYTASVANSVTTMTATPTLSDPTATVQVTGGTGLVVGPNTVTAKVTAQDGTTIKTYTIVVSRLPSSNANLSALAISSGTLSPVFTSSGTSYTASVANLSLIHI